MRLSPVVGACSTILLGFAQLGVACALSGVVAQMDGQFTTELNVLTSCALSMTTSDACTYTYISTTIGIILSVLLIGMVCTTIEGKGDWGFCGPILSFVGFVYFAIYGSIITVTVGHANAISLEAQGLRQATIGLAWGATGLYALTFFLSAATSAKATREPGHRSTLARTLTRTRYRQPNMSPATSPKKAWIPVEQGSPKKWHQPPNARSKFVVTSNGVRTLLVVAGTPTTLSRQTTMSVDSAPGSPTKISLPGSPTKISLPGTPTHPVLGNLPLPHSFGQPGVPAPQLPQHSHQYYQQAISHAGSLGLPHSASQPVMRSGSASSMPPLMRGHSSAQPALLRGSSTASASSHHRLSVAGSDAGSSSTGNTPRDPEARV